MIKEQNLLFKRVQFFADLFLVAVSFFIGYFLRDKILDISPMNFLGTYLRDENLRAISYYAIYIGLLPVLLIIWGGLLHYFGMYKAVGIVKIPAALIIVLKTAVVGFILLGSYVFILRMQEDISRLFIGFVFVSASLLISIEKILLAYIYNILSRTNINFKSSLIVFRRILIVGINKRSMNFIDLISKNPDWGINIVGLIDIDAGKKVNPSDKYKVLGYIKDIPEIISNNIIDEVVFIVPRTWLNRIEEAMLYCESAGIKVHLAVNLFQLKFSKAKQTDLRGFPLLTFENITGSYEQLFMKRMLDFLISGIGIIVLFPFLIIVCMLIKITSEGPVFFKQQRCTLHGRRFTFYKFRTMVVDAESQLEGLLKYNEMSGPVFKMTNDPRVTGIGKWLRKFSIDELPQLWNVFKGDMSLVGPRPPLPHEVENYDIWQRRRLSMRPGITCLWQTSGRNKIADFSEWMKLDLVYIDNWSLGLDFKILLKTIPVVLSGLGAR